MIGTSCAGNRNNERLLREQPSRRNLSRRCILLLRKLSEKINNRHICGNVFRRKTWELRSNVHLWVELRSGIYASGIYASDGTGTLLRVVSRTPLLRSSTEVRPREKAGTDLPGASR